MSKQPPPAPTASAIGPCPTIIQIVGRPGTGSLPRTIAPPDHPLYIPELQRKQLSSLPVCFSGGQSHFKMGSSLEGNKLLLVTVCLRRFLYLSIKIPPPLAPKARQRPKTKLNRAELLSLNKLKIKNWQDLVLLP